jgi:glyoxylase-like metal-dependent hydrolase (beta-lactamase superfamily II)
MLIGRGGNIGLSVGVDGAFLIDDQFAPLTEKIRAAVAALTDQPVRFLVNTHWHRDHTGGNENLGRAGAIIVAHDNVRRRMSRDQFLEAFDQMVPASPKGALPVLTFNDAVTFHLNGDEVHVFHVEHAHTDGDAIIHFRRANVVHMGDTYFNGMYPFIDVSSGGSIEGMIDAVDRVLPLADAKTRLIPGHGPLSNVLELQAYREMLGTVRDRIRALVADGKSREEVIEAGPTRDFDASWGGGFMKPDQWAGIVYDGMVTEERD